MSEEKGATRAHFIVIELLALGVNQMEIMRRSGVNQGIVSSLKLKKSHRPSYNTTMALEKLLAEVKTEHAGENHAEPE